MPDISMCMCNQSCPDRFFCYRHEASGTQPNNFNPSYIRPENHGKDQCEHWWPINDNTNTNFQK